MRILEEKLTFIKPKALREIVDTVIDTVIDIEKNSLPEIYIEVGCALGGSAIAISSYKKKIDICMFITYLE